MPEIVCEVEVWCGSCGAPLCNQSQWQGGKSKRGLHVEACEKCVEDARAEGVVQGRREGEENGNPK